MTTWFNRNGAWFRIKNGSPADVEPYIHRALLDLEQLKLRSDGLDVMHYTRPGFWSIRSVFGRVEIVMEPTIGGGEKKKKKKIWRKFLMPVPTYDLFTNVGGQTLSGFAVCGGLDWDTPSFFVPPDEERGIRRWDYDVIGSGQFDSEQRITFGPPTAQGEAFRLKRIDTIDDYDEFVTWDAPYEYEKTTLWGPEETELGPMAAVTGVQCKPLDWVLTAYSLDYAELRCNDEDLPEYNSVYRIYMIPSAMRLPFIAFLRDAYSWSYFTSFWIDGDRGRWPQGPEQWITERAVYEGHTTLSVGDIQIVAGTTTGLTVKQSIGNLNTEESRTWISEQSSEYEPSPQQGSMVMGHEEYEDGSTWIVMWHTWEVEFENYREVDPWIHEPYYGELEPPAVYWVTGRHYVTASGAWGTKTWEYCESAYGTPWGEGDYEPIDPWRTRIFDFFGEPVYVFTWRDRRDDSYAGYGMIFQGELYLSRQYSPSAGHVIRGFAAQGVGNAFGSAFGVSGYQEEEQDDFS